MATGFTRRSFLADSFALVATLALSSSTIVGATESRTGRFYVLDTSDPLNNSMIWIYDAATFSIVNSLEARYHPDIALSSDGSRLFVCDSNLNEPRRLQPSGELRIYDTITLDLLTRKRFRSRPCYPVAPRLNGMALSGDDRYVYIMRRKRTRRGRVITYDVAAGEWKPSVTLPDSVSFMATIPGTQLLVVALEGRGIDDICIVDLAANDPNPPGLRAGFPRPRVYGDRISGISLDPSGAFIYVITYGGKLRVLNASDAVTISEHTLDIPSNSYVTADHFLLMNDSLVVGTAAKAQATCGKADLVFIYDSSTMKRRAFFRLNPASEQLVPSLDSSLLYGTSYFANQSITAYSNGRPAAKLEHPARSLAHLVVAPTPV
jgi:WD40 repeat protein